MGIAALLKTGSPLYYVIKYAGAAYLIYLGIKGFKGILLNRKKAISPGYHQERQPVPAQYKRFLEAFSVSASNPKTVIFLSAFLPQFVSAGHSIPLQFALMFLSIAIIVSCIHTTYAFLLVRAKNRMSPRVENTILPGISSGIYLCLGIGMGASR